MVALLESATTSAGYFDAATINKPSGTSIGDVLVASVYSDIATGPPTPISGFTLISSIDPFGPGGWETHSLQYRVVDGSEGASFSTPNSGMVIMARISGANTASPLASGAGLHRNGTATSSNYPSVTTTEADTLLVAIGFIPASLNPDAVTFGGGAPDIAFSSYSSNVNHRGFVNAEIVASAGATGTRSLATAAASVRFGGMIAIAADLSPPPPTIYRPHHGLMLPV